MLSISVFILRFAISFSAINDILDADSFTLEDLLKEEEILQEIKSKNSRLIEL